MKYKKFRQNLLKEWVDYTVSSFESHYLNSLLEFHVYTGVGNGVGNGVNPGRGRPFGTPRGQGNGRGLGNNNNNNNNNNNGVGRGGNNSSNGRGIGLQIAAQSKCPVATLRNWEHSHKSSWFIKMLLCRVLQVKVLVGLKSKVEYLQLNVSLQLGCLWNPMHRAIFFFEYHLHQSR